ncbi:MAG: hypothetical protein ABIA93_01840 [Candidatus Woesearchaeota archaeon]
MAAPKSIGTKVKKKHFVPIIAPKLFSHELIGETPVTESKQLVGRRISANFMTLTNDFKKQHISLKFTITGVTDGKANTMLTGYEVAPSFLKRLIRRGRTKISDSFVFTTSDGVKVRIKPVMVTQGKVPSKTGTSLRASFHEQMTALAEKETFTSLAGQFLDGSLQKHFRQSLGKKYPLKHLEIKAFLAVSEAKESDVHSEEEPVEQDALSEQESEEPTPKKSKKKVDLDDSEEEDAEESKPVKKSPKKASKKTEEDSE